MRISRAKNKRGTIIFLKFHVFLSPNLAKSSYELIATLAASQNWPTKIIIIIIIIIINYIKITYIIFYIIIIKLHIIFLFFI